MAALGVFLCAGDRVCRLPAVSVLLDDHHDDTAGQRALPPLERAELRTVLDH